MKKVEETKRNSIGNKVVWAALLAVLLALGVFGGSFVYAKYYAQSVKSGIAIASGVYFTANYAYAVDSAEDEFLESIVRSGYQGKDTDYVFEIRNYENYMLFNEASVEIPYSVSFWLGETPVNANYTVVYEDTTYPLVVGQEQKVSFTDRTITGGRATANKYTIRIDVLDENTVHTSVPVYVMAQTQQGAVVNVRLHGKMVVSTEVQAEDYIESQMFSTSMEATTDDLKFKEILNKSELIYEIKTVGKVTGDNSTEELKLSWNPEILEINRFDDAFLEWKRSKEEGDPPRDNPYRDTATGWDYITVKVMPYSAETVGFFRGSRFNIEVTDLEALHSNIQAERYTVQ